MTQRSGTGVQRKPKLWLGSAEPQAAKAERLAQSVQARLGQARFPPSRSRSTAMQATTPVPMMVPQMDAMIVHISH